MGNNYTCIVVGHGSVRIIIHMFDGVIRTIEETRYVHVLRRNLLSFSSFDKKAYEFSSKGGVLRVFKYGFDKLRAKRKTFDLYLLDRKTILSDAIVVSKSLSDPE